MNPFTLWANPEPESGHIATLSDGQNGYARLAGFTVLFRVFVPPMAKQPALMVPFGGVPGIYYPARKAD